MLEDQIHNNNKITKHIKSKMTLPMAPRNLPPIKIYPNRTLRIINAKTKPNSQPPPGITNTVKQHNPQPCGTNLPQQQQLRFRHALKSVEIQAGA